MANIPKQCLSNVLVRNVVFPYLRALKSSNVDSIDCFTNELVEKQNFQWKISIEKYLQVEEKYMRYKQRIPMDSSKKWTNLEKNVRLLDECQMRLDRAMKEEDSTKIISLLDEYIALEYTFSEEVINDILEFAVRVGKKDVIEKMRYFCAKTQPDFLLKSQRFVLHEIRILWNEGNSERALNRLKNAYQDLVMWNHTEVHRILRIFTKEIVGKKSEGVLLNFINLAEDISSRCNDNFPLEIIWRDCFFSRWFSDQEVAVGLFCKHPEIQKFVQQQVKLITFKLLMKHRIETVYRLIELLLDGKVNMKDTCREVLMVLFDYQYWRNNSTGCSEIIQSSIDLRIPLGPKYEKKLVILLLKPRKIISTKKEPPPTINYKF